MILISDNGKANDDLNYNSTLIADGSMRAEFYVESNADQDRIGLDKSVGSHIFWLKIWSSVLKIKINLSFSINESTFVIAKAKFIIAKRMYS